MWVGGSRTGEGHAGTWETAAGKEQQGPQGMSLACK